MKILPSILIPRWTISLNMAWFACIIILVMMPIYDFDIFWHLANGRAMIDQGRIIQEEIFSYTSFGVPFGNNQWLSQVILYLFFLFAGGFGLILFTILMTLSTLSLILRSMPDSAPDSRWVSSFFCFAAVAAGITRFMPRPHLFSFLGIGITLWLLFRYCKGDRPSPQLLIAFVVVILIWNSLHGAIYGLILLFCHLLAALIVKSNIGNTFLTDRPLSRSTIVGLSIAFFASVLVSISVPVGFNLLLMIKNLLFSQTMAQFTSEFTPPGFTPLHAGYWALLGLTVIYLLRDLVRRNIDLAQTLILLAFGLLSLRYMRATAPFLLVSIPYLTQRTTHLFNRKLEVLSAQHRAKPILPIAGLVVAIAITVFIKTGLFLGPVFRFGTDVDRTPNSKYPVGATNFVNASTLSGNLYNSNHFGGYLAYYLEPGRPIFHYNHVTLFPDMYKLAHNKEALEKFNINYAIVGDSIETQYTFTPPEWVPVYWERKALVLVRDQPENRAIIDRFRIYFFTPEITEAQIESFSKNPNIATKLTVEMGTYLRFRPDPRVAALFAQLLLQPTLHLSTVDRVDWAKAALVQNRESVQLAQSLASLTQSK